MRGDYSVIITGPSGVVMSAVIDLQNRDMPLALAIDDAHLHELLVVNAMCGGVIEGVMENNLSADPMTTTGLWRVEQGGQGPVKVLEESVQQAMDRLKGEGAS